MYTYVSVYGHVYVYVYVHGYGYYIYMCVCVGDSYIIMILGFHKADQLPAAWGLWKRLFRFQSSMLSVAEAETSVEKEENGIGNPPKKIKIKI